jgi:hypothetical protein
MAELLLKIGDSPNPLGYKDGDILEAFNRRRIRNVHAQHICHIDKVKFNEHGLNPLDSLPFHYQQNVYQYKFERVQDAVVRTDLINGGIEVFGRTPNAKGEYIDVELFLAQRKKHPKHRIFGTEGHEVWFGGRIDNSNSKLDKVWTKIEAVTPFKEVDHQLWPLTEKEKQNYLAIPVDDFTDDDAGLWTSTVVADPEDDNSPILAKRGFKIPYKDLPDVTSRVALSKILNKQERVDIRYPANIPKNVISKKGG